jgi:hypothetical protein
VEILPQCGRIAGTAFLKSRSFEQVVIKRAGVSYDTTASLEAYVKMNFHAASRSRV